MFRVVPLKQGQAAAATIARIHGIHALDAPRPINPSIDRRVDQSIQFSAPTRSICEWLSVADHHAHNPTDRLRPSSNGWDGWDDWMDGYSCDATAFPRQDPHAGSRRSNRTPNPTQDGTAASACVPTNRSPRLYRSPAAAAAGHHPIIPSTDIISQRADGLTD